MKFHYSNRNLKLDGNWREKPSDREMIKCVSYIIIIFRIFCRSFATTCRHFPINLRDFIVESQQCNISCNFFACRIRVYGIRHTAHTRIKKYEFAHKTFFGCQLHLHCKIFISFHIVVVVVIVAFFTNFLLNRIKIFRWKRYANEYEIL